MPLVVIINDRQKFSFQSNTLLSGVQWHALVLSWRAAEGVSQKLLKEGLKYCNNFSITITALSHTKSLLPKVLHDSMSGHEKV